jgi:excisionase family DNA binding protein
MRRSLSPRDLAQAMGVSESSLKRWIDAGRLQASRTEGGHRRITISDAIRFVREHRHPIVRPDLLGLPALPPPTDPDAADDLFFRHLHDGDAAAVRGFLLGRYLEGEPVAAISDGPVRTALERIGELWKHSAEGIFVEHRASDLVLQAFAQIRATLEPAPGAPVALGCAPSGDSHLLPTFVAATVLAADDFDAINLGPDTPAAALEAAIARHAPRMIWISVSMPIAAEVGTTLARLLQRQASAGRGVIVGGRHVERVPARAGVLVATSMRELSAFARGLSRHGA